MICVGFLVIKCAYVIMPFEEAPTMNVEISNIINLVMKVADFYEENLGDEVFANWSVSLKNALLNDLATYSLILCSVDGSVSDERIKTINYYFDQNLYIHIQLMGM